MRGLAFALSVFFTHSLAADEPKPEPGTVELFNGKDLTGWGYKSGDKFESFDDKTSSCDER
jgi:hypothetical protein